MVRESKFMMGLIPAHAGKTPHLDSRRPVPRAHPRSRGENVDLSRDRRRTPGSSPLTRGKRRSPVHRDLRVGLIPAHAGKTLGRRPTTQARRAHPRSRGENRARPGCPSTGAGSSPLTRGKHPDDGADRGGLGLIPAHAGKTATRRRTKSPQRAHPRSRGENS